MQHSILDGAAANEAAQNPCEPSLAVHGSIVLYTGNFFAAFSTDRGQTFSYLDPSHTFPDPDGMVFQCDQVAHYAPATDTFFWLLQYTLNQTTFENVQRLAYATSAGLAAGRWQFFDITPASLGLPARSWLDFPDIAVGPNYVYVATNVYNHAADGHDPWTNSGVVRISLQSLHAGNPRAEHSLSGQYPVGRLVQGCGATAYWASHNAPDELCVFFWPEGETNVSSRTVAVPATDMSAIVASNTPAGENWLGHADYRMLGATLAGTNLWFSWTTNHTGDATTQPTAYTQLARIDTRTFQCVESPSIFFPGYAAAYATLATNGNGQVGVSYMVGGGPAGAVEYPYHVVGVLVPGGEVGDSSVSTAISTTGPAGGRWGDFLTLRADDTNPAQFAAAAYTTQLNGQDEVAAPFLVVFNTQG